jgi:hypothetical protein
MGLRVIQDTYRRMPTGPACTEALDEAEKVETRERAEGIAGGAELSRALDAWGASGYRTDHDDVALWIRA